MASDSAVSAIRRTKAKKIIFLIIGWMIAAFNGSLALICSFATGLKDKSSVFLLFLFLSIASVGVLFIVIGTKAKHLLRNYYEYSARLSADPNGSIDLLAAALGKPASDLAKELSEMITLGFFPGAFIDTKYNRVVFTGGDPTKAKAAVGQASGHSSRYVMVKCKGCGATNKILSGTVGECEYCGSRLSAN